MYVYFICNVATYNIFCLYNLFPICNLYKQIRFPYYKYGSLFYFLFSLIC